MTDEYTDALRLAERILDRPHADPDDDIAILARQLIRTAERAEKYFDQVRHTCARAEKAEGELAAAQHELSCCDDIPLNQGLAAGISALQADREYLHRLVTDLKGDRP